MNQEETVTAAAQQDQQIPTKPKKKVVRYREFHKRQFLNLPDKESDAYISVHLKNSRWDGYTINITDCNQKIALHGSLNKLKSRKNALHKIDSLIGALQEFRDHMAAEFKRHNLRS